MLDDLELWILILGVIFPLLTKDGILLCYYLLKKFISDSYFIPDLIIYDLESAFL